MSDKKKIILKILSLSLLVCVYVTTSLVLRIVLNFSIGLSLILFSFGFVFVIVCEVRLVICKKEKIHTQEQNKIKQKRNEKIEYVGSYVLLILSIIINLAGIIVFIIR